MFPLESDMMEEMQMGRHNGISREVFFYLVFGVLTTLVNIVSFAILSRAIGIGTVFSNVIAWFLSVLFAYVTNRRWVFQSKSDDVLKEAAAFFSGRLGTGVLDTLVMFVTVDLLCWNDLVMKVISNVIVIILNYIISKLFVFKSGKPAGDDKETAEE